MPARHYVVAIVLFWVATAGWLFHREFWPALRPGDPPPFHVDLVDEARQMRLHWTIYRGQSEEKVGFATTGVEYREQDDTFDLQGDYHLTLSAPNLGKIVATARSGYRVTREGALREIVAEATLLLEPLPPGPPVLVAPPSYSLKGHIRGPVSNGSFQPDGKVQFLEVEQKLWERRLKLDPVPVTGLGTVVDPLHPVNRIPDLRGGQHWRVPHLDPLAITLTNARFDGKSDQVTALLQFALTVLTESRSKKALIGELDAEVQAAPELLSWQGGEEWCWVIHYRGQDLTARTWVRQSDGLVLQQEATLLGDRLVLKRNHDRTERRQ